MKKSIAIKVEGLSKKYTFQNDRLEEFHALKDVSFELLKGETVGIFGSNGSGKSTLLKILAGITKPTSGKVTTHGRVASILDVGAGFHPELSGRENVFLNGQIHGFSKKEICGKFDEIVTFSGIEKFIDQPVKNYSSGMFLRLAFSIIIHLDFDVYLFDEVLSVGDQKFQIESNKKIQELIKLEKSIVIVSHNLADFSNFDKYIWLNKSELVAYSKDRNILSHYILENSQILAPFKSNKVELKDFSKYVKSDELEVVKVSLFQKEVGNLQTDNPTFIRIEFEKLKSKGTIEPAFSFSDINDNKIFTSAPFISGIPDITLKGNYIYECEIPPYFLGLKPYYLNIYFLQNLFRDNHNNKSYEDLSILNSVFRLEKLFVFKAQFKPKKHSNHLNDIDLDGGILPALRWKLINR